jgi:multimeric flavodoxin WrbA
MQKVYAELTEADALVLGSPIYMGQMSAQTVTFVDRLFSQITPRFSPQFKEYNAGKMLVLAITQGNPDEKLFKTYIDYVAGMFGLLEFVVKEVVVIAGTRTTSAVEVPNLAETLMEAGATLVHEKSIHQ